MSANKIIIFKCKQKQRKYVIYIKRHVKTTNFTLLTHDPGSTTDYNLIKKILKYEKSERAFYTIKFLEGESSYSSRSYLTLN